MLGSVGILAKFWAKVNDCKGVHIPLDARFDLQYNLAIFMNRRFWVVLIIVAAILGGCIGWCIRYASTINHAAAQTTQVRINSPEYEFINPLLFSDNAKSSSAYMNNLDAAVSSVISVTEKDPSINSASVYFRDLNSAQWTGVDEDALYKPSSMLKTLAMMAAFKMAEQDPAILSEKLFFHKALAGGTYYEGDKTMTEGYYTLSKLIDVMIQSSDNDAFLAIISDQKINDEFVKTYNLLQLPPAGLTGNADFMSPKSYAVLFRTLYNSTFFSWNISEQALDLLSKTTFDNGLVAGVPSGMKVAHKFGENTNQLHDCGIVYYPEHPYLLCIMTKGQDLSKLESLIAAISKTVYGYVNSTPLPQKVG